MSAIVAAAFVFLALKGWSYYSTPLELRPDHPDHAAFKPSGFYGHGLGIVGTFLILFGVTIYIARKRYGFLASFGRLKYWLEFHIFLCSLGPVLVLFHTAFKFGGIVSVAFWSMVAVVASGVLGRFIYVQIPRTIEGRALSMAEAKNLRDDLAAELREGHFSEEKNVAAALAATAERGPSGFVAGFFDRRKKAAALRRALVEARVEPAEARRLTALAADEMSLAARIVRLHKMQELFKYWHVAHLPFALIMLVIVVLHVGVALAFGYKWVF